MISPGRWSDGINSIHYIAPDPTDSGYSTTFVPDSFGNLVEAPFSFHGKDTDLADEVVSEYLGGYIGRPFTPQLNLQTISRTGSAMYVDRTLSIYEVRIIPERIMVTLIKQGPHGDIIDTTRKDAFYVLIGRELFHFRHFNP